MLLQPISVACYAGYKAEETPRRFLWKDQWWEVSEILDRWQQVESLPEWPRATYFKVAVGPARQFLLKHDQESGAWFLAKEWYNDPER